MSFILSLNLFPAPPQRLDLVKIVQILNWRGAELQCKVGTHRFLLASMPEVLIETFACIMKKILENSRDLTESEEGADLLLLILLLTSEPCQGQFAFFMFLQEKFIEETFLRNGTVESLQTTVGQEFIYVCPIVNK